jgi:hypothetical protein
MRNSSFFLVFPLTLAACSVSDVGETEVRRVGVIDASTDEGAAIAAVTAVCGAKPGKLRGLGESSLSGLAALKQGSAIAKDEMFSLRLRSGFLSDNLAATENLFSDLSLSAKGLGETSVYFGRGAAGHNLELLIAARVFDIGASTPQGGAPNAFRFNAIEDAKVLYQSDDVYEGQRFSFANLPIIGPIKYSGAGLGYQFRIIELDDQSGVQKALVEGALKASTAAAIGSPGGLAGAALTTVVGMLLDNGPAEDFIFQADGAFDSGAGAALGYARLDEGLYVIAADYARQASIPWGRLALDTGDAHLYECVGSAAEPSPVWKPYVGATYLVVQVLKQHGVPAATISAESYGEYIKRVKEAQSGQISKINELSTAFATQVVAAGLYDDAIALVGRIDSAMAAGEPSAARLAADRLATLLKDHKPNATPSGDRKAALTEAQADEILQRLYGVAANRATARKDTVKPEAFSIAEIDKLKGVLSQLFPDTPASPNG